MLPYDVTQLWKLNLILVICFSVIGHLSVKIYTFPNTTVSAQFPLNSLLLGKEQR